MSDGNLTGGGEMPGWVRTGLLLLSALGVAALLLSLSHWLLYAALLIAMTMALVLWILNFDKPLARWLYAMPLGRPALDAICRLTEEPLPTSAPTADHKMVDLAQFGRALRERFPHQEAVTDKLIETVSRKCSLRQNLKGEAHEPLAVILMVGRPALGKRTMALTAGTLLFGGDCVVVIAPDGQPAAIRRAIATAMRRRCRLVVLESIEKAETETIEVIQNIITTGRFSALGEPPVDCSAAMFVLTVQRDISERDADALARIDWRDPGSSVGPIVQLTSLQPALVSRLDAFISMRLPTNEAILDAVGTMFQSRAQDFGLEISVDPEIIGNEVAQVRKVGDFSQAPGRIKKLSEPAIQMALRSQAPRADIRNMTGETG